MLYVNILIGTLGGLTPLSDGPGSASATTQAVSILVLQLGMACYCFCLAPDADKISSMFAGTQYLVESLSVACALWAALAAGSIPEDVVMLAFTLAILAVCSCPWLSSSSSASSLRVSAPSGREAAASWP